MRETFQSQVESHTRLGLFRSHPPCSNARRHIQIPSPHLQCISAKFPFTLTPCQITAVAYDGQKHSFPYRA